jgi:hypothetical protein
MENKLITSFHSTAGLSPASWAFAAWRWSCAEYARRYTSGAADVLARIPG